MRTILSISAMTLLLAACADDRPVTGPSSEQIKPTSPGAATGPTLAQAAAGKPASFSLITTAIGTTKSVFGEPSNQGASSIATCPAGSVVAGGGFSISIGARDIRIIESKPNAAGTAWIVNAAWYGDDFDGGNYASFSAVATCIK